MIGVSITMNGGPGLVSGPTALEAFLELQEDLTAATPASGISAPGRGRA